MSNNKPVPEILLIKELRLASETVSVCVQNRISGDTLERGKIHYNDRDPEELKDYIRQGGELLSRIHSISTNGFGYLDKDGSGEIDSMPDLLKEYTNKPEKYVDLAEKVGLNDFKISDVLDDLDEAADSMGDVRPVLVHGDYNLKHFMADEGKITGIIDWGQAQGGTPLEDFAKWEYWFRDLPLKWLQAGYTNKELFEEDFDRRLRIVMLKNGLDVLGWYAKTGYAEGIERAKKRLVEIYQANRH